VNCPLIKAAHLSKSYGNVVALNGIDLEIMRGEFCVIAGPNGAGKTTFLRILYGEAKPDGGEVFVAPLQTPMGVMPQEASLYEDLTVWEHVYYLTRIKGIKNSAERAESAIIVADLEEKRDALIRELSGGYKRRVNLAQALAGSDDLLVLDEPSSGLDPEARRSMLEAIGEMHRKGTTIVFTTHYLDEIESEVDRMVIFNRGEIVYSGDKKGILDRIGYDYEIESTYESSIAEMLKGLNVVFSVEGKTMHLYLSKKDLTPELFSVLGQDIKIQRPSLEEAYLRRIGDEDH